MTPSLRIALRFLTHRKRALLLSLSGVVFGVPIFIYKQAQTQGFARQFINSTIGSNGALMIRHGSRVTSRSWSLEDFRRQGGTPLVFRGSPTQQIMRVSRQFSNVVSVHPCCEDCERARRV
jgi:ABC-type lipoprotein release transport system permease subunit